MAQNSRRLSAPSSMPPLAEDDNGSSVGRMVESLRSPFSMRSPLLGSSNDLSQEDVTSKLGHLAHTGSFMATGDPFSRVFSETSQSEEPQSAHIFGASPARAKRRLADTVSDPLGWLAAAGASLPLVLLSYSSCVSYAQLIATGSPLNANVLTAMHLFSSGLTGLVLPLLSNCPLVVPSADISVTLFYTNIVQDIVRSATGLPKETVAATAMLALPFNTILMSLVFYVVGSKKATVAVSYLPYPVVAGFLGSIGFAIFAGSFAVLSASGEKVPVPAGLPKLASEVPWQLFCAVAMAMSSLMLKAQRCSARVIAVAPMTVSLVGFWLWVLVSRSDIESLRQAGWLFPASADQPFWELWTAQQPSAVDWMLLIPHPSTFLGLGMVLVLSLALRIAGIEGSTGMVLDVDEEVKWTGISNMFVGLSGCVIGSHSPGLTTFNQQAGSKCVRAALVTAALQLGLWLSGVPAMDFFPRFLLAGILMNLGLVMLLEWMWIARHKVGKLGLLVIYAQVTSSALFGLLPSVLIGVAVACATAQAQLMSLHVLKFHLSGKSVSSAVQRPESQRRELAAMSDQIEALGLEGQLGEGPMVKFATYLRAYIKRNRRVRYMLFDFSFVQGTNPSACALLAKLDKTLEDSLIRAVYSNVQADMASRLMSFGVDSQKIFKGDDTIRSFQHALKHCEDMVLSSADCIDWPAVLADPPEQRELKVSEELIPTYIARLAEGLQCTMDQAGALAKAGQWACMGRGATLVRQGMCTTKLHIGVPGYSEIIERIDVGESCGPSHEVAIDRSIVFCAPECALYGEPARTTFSISSQCESILLIISKDAIEELAARDLDLFRKMTATAAKLILRRGDALSQALELHKGGGWRGATFDRRTAEAAASLFSDDQALGTITSPAASRAAQPAPPKNSSKPKLTRQSSVVEWAAQWLEQRRTAALERISSGRVS